MLGGKKITDTSYYYSLLFTGKGPISELQPGETAVSSFLLGTHTD